MTCSMAFEVENNVPLVYEMPPESTVERWVGDSRYSRFMTPSADYIMTNYRERLEASLKLLTTVRYRSKGLGISR